MIVEMKCEQVWGEISNYVDDQVDSTLRMSMEQHFKTCRRCSAVLDGTRNVVQLLGDQRSVEPPAGYSRRLYSKIENSLETKGQEEEGLLREIEVGITNDRVALGSHLLYFWENDEEFARGVRFLYPGLGRGEHCIIFGHDEVLQRVSEVLRAQGFDPEQLIANRELTVLRRHAVAEATISDIAAVVETAQRMGNRVIRFLGNLGLGRDPLPAGEDDVVQLENMASALISQMPCVIVCMYDVRTVSGRLILHGGLETHRLTVCSEGVQQNPYFHFPGPTRSPLV